MPRLSQIVAIEKGIKNQSNVEITGAYHAIQKPALFAGIAKTYQPKDAEGDTQPPQRQHVQQKAHDLLRFTAKSMTKYWDMTLTKDSANTSAFGDIRVDGHVILANVPVSFLIFLEKQLTDFATMIKKLPTLDPGDVWHYDAASNAYATEPVLTQSTKKVPKSFVRVAATKEHPAQADLVHEDIVIGTWTTIKYSGALPAKQIEDILERVTKLQAAVKFAREEANTIQVTEREVGHAVFEYLLG